MAPVADVAARARGQRLRVSQRGVGRGDVETHRTSDQARAPGWSVTYETGACGGPREGRSASQRSAPLLPRHARRVECADLQRTDARQAAHLHAARGARAACAVVETR